MVLPAAAALVSICLSRNVRSEDAVISWKTYRETYALIGNSWEMLISLKKVNLIKILFTNLTSARFFQTKCTSSDTSSRNSQHLPIRLPGIHSIFRYLSYIYIYMVTSIAGKLSLALSGDVCSGPHQQTHNGPPKGMLTCDVLRFLVSRLLL